MPRNEDKKLTEDIEKMKSSREKNSLALPVPMGTGVVYHGSMSEYAGRYVVKEVFSEETHSLSSDGHRYSLRSPEFDMTLLWNVRRQSFTVVEPVVE